MDCQSAIDGAARHIPTPAYCLHEGSVLAGGLEGVGKRQVNCVFQGCEHHSLGSLLEYARWSVAATHREVCSSSAHKVREPLRGGTAIAAVTACQLLANMHASMQATTKRELHRTGQSGPAITSGLQTGMVFPNGTRRQNAGRLRQHAWIA